MRVKALCLAKHINLSLLDIEIRKSGLTTTRYSKCLQIHEPSHPLLCHVFSNGCVIFWNTFKEDHQHLLSLLQAELPHRLTNTVAEDYLYFHRSTTKLLPHEYFNVEIILLEDEDPESKLSIAYGLAQSIKLKHYESLLEAFISANQPLITKLKSRKPLRRKTVQHHIADILLIKTTLNLDRDFLYQPHFFWQHANLEPNYLLAKEYFDVAERIQTVNQQLDALHEIYEMMNGYLTNRHGHFLEWIIIFLITTEIFFNFFNIHG